MIAHSAVEVSKAADRLVNETLADFTRAMRALAAGDIEAAKARFDLAPVVVHSRDEVGDMALNFNRLQAEIGRAAGGLEGAREGLSQARGALTETNERLRLELAERVHAQTELREAHAELETRVIARTAELTAEVAERKQAQEALAAMNSRIAVISRKAGMAEVATGVLHNVGNVLNSVNVAANIIGDRVRASRVGKLGEVVALLRAQNGGLADFLTNDPRGKLVPGLLGKLTDGLRAEHASIATEAETLVSGRDLHGVFGLLVAGDRGKTRALGPARHFEKALRHHRGAPARAHDDAEVDLDAPGDGALRRPRPRRARVAHAQRQTHRGNRRARAGAGRATPFRGAAHESLRRLPAARGHPVNLRPARAPGESRDARRDRFVGGGNPRTFALGSGRRCDGRFSPRLFRGEPLRRHECAFHTKAGELRRGLLWLEPFALATGPHMIAILQDVTEQTAIDGS